MINMSARKCPSKKADQVLDAARQLFLERGFDATSMDDVAETAGVSKATVYAHYNCKTTLFAEVMQHECQRSKVHRAIAGKIKGHYSLEVSLTKIGRAYLDTLMRPDLRALARMVIAEATRFPELGKIYYDSGPTLTRTSLVTYLEQARQEGALIDCDVQQAAIQFLSLLRGDIHIRRLLGHPSNDEACQKTIDEAVTTFMARYAVSDN